MNWKRICLLLVVAALAAILWFREPLTRLYHVVTLFDEDKIVGHFSAMDDVGLKAITVKRAGPIREFEKAPQPLPANFEFQQAKINVDEYLQRTSTTALVVLKNDSITHERYFQDTTETDQRISWSVAKSFLSAVFGIAHHEGQIPDLMAPVTDYVPELKGSGYDGVPIKHVLQMSSGVKFNEDYQDFNSDINRFGRLLALGGSFDEFSASLVNDRPAGSYHHYVSIDTHVLGMVLRQATKQSFADYFAERLYSKMGAEADMYIIADDQNEPMVLGGMNMRSRDFLRFGALIRDGGQWNGQQIVPKAWIQASVTPDAPHLQPGKRDSSDMTLGYGYQWWIPQDADQEFMALGIYGQHIYINQKADVVVVKNSADLHFMDNNFQSADEAVAFFRAVVSSLNN